MVSTRFKIRRGVVTRALMQLGAIQFNTSPTSDWSCDDWVFWHQELVKAFKAGRFKSRIKYSEAEAIRLSNKVFSEWWGKQNWSIFTNWCGYNSNFFNYFKGVGLTDHISYVAAIVTPLLNAGTEVADSAGKVITVAGKTVEDVADAVSNTAKQLKWVGPVLITGAAVGLGVFAYKRFLQ